MVRCLSAEVAGHTLKGSIPHARDHYPAVSGLQEPELFDDQEQEDDDGSAGVQEVLQHVPEAYAA
jgi:hypothetical protein